jgi:hypothetical protein
LLVVGVGWYLRSHRILAWVRLFSSRRLCFLFNLSLLFLSRRPYKELADVQSSWNKDKMVNYLVLRMTPLGVPLNRLFVCPFLFLIADAFA